MTLVIKSELIGTSGSTGESASALADLIYQGLRIVVGHDNHNSGIRALVLDSHGIVHDDIIRPVGTPEDEVLDDAKDKVRHLTGEWAVQSVNAERLLRNVEGQPINNRPFDPQIVANLTLE